MFVTRLHGHVAPDNWNRLQQHYTRLVQSLPDGLIDTYLIQNSEQPTSWEILTIWLSEETYESVRAQKKTEACELLFIDVDGIPERESFRVKCGHQRI
jgi:hypothetical protein